MMPAVSEKDGKILQKNVITLMYTHKVQFMNTSTDVNKSYP